METNRPSRPRQLLVPGLLLVLFWALALVMWRSSGYIQSLFLFGYIGTSLGLGLGLYAILPKKKKPIGRRVALLLIGTFLIGFLGLYGGENIQIEGLFFGLFTGVVQAGVMHYLIAKLVGPLLFGRLWCGWACWTVMVLDLLPYRRPAGRLPGRWGWLRYLHFAASLGLAALLWFGFGRSGIMGRAGLTWFIAGNLLYYAIGIGLAVALQDNRAFCKYVCPVSVPLKLTSRFSLLKIGTDAARCNGCRACEQLCPMDVRIADFALEGRRVLSSECTLCQTCITVCAHDALKLSAGLDVAGKDRLRLRAKGS